MTSVIYPFIILASMKTREITFGRTMPALVAGAPVVCSRGFVVDLRLGILLLNLLGLLLISSAHTAG